MSDYIRYAIYYMPPPGPLADFGAGWLGWDAASGQAVPQPTLGGIGAVTKAPGKYGFHGTLKAPFRLAAGCTPEALDKAVAAMAADTVPVRLRALVLGSVGRFLALVPEGPAPDLECLATRCVKELDSFRAPMTGAELDRRRTSGLTDRQDALLQRWGYPYVMEQFRFHMTLTGNLDALEKDRFRAEIANRLPDLPRPYLIDQIALVGERADGRFETCHRYTLTG